MTEELSLAQRFARLFHGYEARYGRYDVTGREASGKRTGTARTVDKPITPQDYDAHVSGHYGIGVIPLTEDNTVHFAALDIDQYGDKAPDHWHWALMVKEDPLIVTKSKSGGMHIWLFSKEGVPAQIAIDYMRSVAARLGFSGCEIFPKQAGRSSTSDVGNWINLPYFGDERTAVIPEKTDVGFARVDATLEQFLLVGELVAATVTPSSLLKLIEDEPNQRDGSSESNTQDWVDAPPCLWIGMEC